MYICAHMYSFLLQVLYMVWCLSKLDTYENVVKTTYVFRGKKEKKNSTDKD
jgi:hypothetical protein